MLLKKILSSFDDNICLSFGIINITIQTRKKITPKRLIACGTENRQKLPVKNK